MHSILSFFRWSVPAFTYRRYLGMFITIVIFCRSIPPKEAKAENEVSSVPVLVEPLSLSLADIGFPQLTEFRKQDTPHIAGEKVIVIVKIQNTSTQPLMLVLGKNPHELVRFSVKTLKGNNLQEVSRTEFSRKFREPSTEPQQVLSDFGGGLRKRNIKPGESLDLKFNLARRFDLSLTGEYEISAFMIPQIIEGEKIESTVLKKVTASPMVIYIRERRLGAQDFNF